VSRDHRLSEHGWVRPKAIARGTAGERGPVTTFPRRVMAANKVASGSALDWRIPMMVPHESFCWRRERKG
jgi:hypothetical protein